MSKSIMNSLKNLKFIKRPHCFAHLYLPLIYDDLYKCDCIDICKYGPPTFSYPQINTSSENTKLELIANNSSNSKIRIYSI